jgi:hypothetical protein
MYGVDNHLRDPPMVDTGGGSEMSRNELGCRNKVRTFTP